MFNAVPHDQAAADEHWMRLALAEAQAAAAAGEVPVGAVLIAADRATMLSTGRNRVIETSDPTAHCEIVAMRAAGQALGNYRLSGTTLYCTLEPCAMCAGAMIHARIARLVYGAADPKAGAHTSALTVLNHEALNHHIEFTTGVLAAECALVLSSFFQRKRRAQMSLSSTSASE